MTRGRFVTLEGGEGAGKSTQARLLADWLRSRGVATTTTREPGGSPNAEALRDLLLSGRVKPFGAEAEALLFAVARADHMETVIRPALEAGTWVICDRFMDSTRAYQGVDGVGAATLDRLERIAVGGDRPDLTIILDIDPDSASGRLARRGSATDRFEADDHDRHRARRAAFLAIAKSEPDRCVVIDADRPADVVHAAIVAAVEARLAPPRAPAGA